MNLVIEKAFTMEMPSICALPEIKFSKFPTF